jgi:hypothetical protein
MRHIKNHSGKIMSKTNREKLLRVWTITTRLIPLVEGFAFVRFRGHNPKIVLMAVTDPTDEELMAMTVFA